MVVVDNENAKVEKKGIFGEGKRQPGHEIAWNGVGGNQTGFVSLSEGLINREVAGEWIKSGAMWCHLPS